MDGLTNNPSTARDNFKMSESVGFVKNETSMVFGLQHSRNWGVIFFEY